MGEKLYKETNLERKDLTLNLRTILKNNDIFISYMILYTLKNFKNVHLFLESDETTQLNDYPHYGRWTTPLAFNIQNLISLRRNKAEFLKINNNFIHYNDFRNTEFFSLKFFYELKRDVSMIYKKEKNSVIDDNELLHNLRKIYALTFLQGYQTTKDTQKFREIRELLGNENKSLIDIIKGMD